MNLTLDAIFAFFEHRIAELRLSGGVTELRETQLAAKALMDAAQSVGDQNAAHRFRVLAAAAANVRGSFSDDD